MIDRMQDDLTRLQIRASGCQPEDLVGFFEELLKITKQLAREVARLREAK